MNRPLSAAELAELQKGTEGHLLELLCTSDTDPGDHLWQECHTRSVEYSGMRKIMRNAHAKGAIRVSMTTSEWDVSGKCGTPVRLELWSRPGSHEQALAARKKRRQDWSANEAAKLLVGDHAWEPPPIEPAGFPRYILGGPGYNSLLRLRMKLRCRRCDYCRWHTRNEWFWRASHEFALASRTWFGTLTLNQRAYFITLTKARKAARLRSINWDELGPGQQFRLHEHAAYTEYVQKYWKRVRKETGSAIRYLAVAELGKETSRLHFHFLLHESNESEPVRWETLNNQWFGHGHGYGKFNLIVPEEPWRVRYTIKYVAKGLLARVRASGRYGKTLSSTVKREQEQRRPKEGAAPHDTLRVQLPSAGRQPSLEAPDSGN